MKYILAFIFFFFLQNSFAQLGFCSGSKGDPIFHENFGGGSGTGSPLSPEITNYTYVTGDPQDGEYTISDDIGNEITSWHQGFPDTNISGGRALVVNADFTAGRFYRKEITGLCESTTYEFSAFLMNVYDPDSNDCEAGGIPNNVRFEIWDETDTNLIKAGDTPNINATSNPEWNQFALTFRSEPGQESVILKMFNNGEGGCGNDLAIDDIIFRSCGDLTTVSSDGQSGDDFYLCQADTPIRLTLVANADSSVYQQQFYQWQISLNGEDWGDIPGANSNIYQTAQINEPVFYRIKVAEDIINLNSNVCSSASDAFHVQIIQTPEPPLSEGNVFACQNEPAPALKVTAESNLLINWYDAETGGNLLAENTNTFFPVSPGVYYAEAIDPIYECGASQRTAVRFTRSNLPELEDEVIKICPESTLTLSAGISGYDYEWTGGETTESININLPGIYSVKVISPEGCFTSKEFTVNPTEIAEIQEVKSVGEDVVIYPVDQGDFLYSLDGNNFQTSPIFESVEAGIYTGYIRDTEGCSIVSLRFAHIVIPRMITPNNDGYNDRFELRGLEFFDRSEIRIFDRYGKLLIQDNGANFTWDGVYNGRDLPADDYWYYISIDGMENKTGHFSLLR
ncbi:T9SS type B sorting domain-containing protein [Christiangramia sabulilitoris]|uniref:T9SS type B sorting domain-containing protein n=1 Tax=Christiangramia sabulilitoris TaxID=2583991 RepID=UPI001FB644C8|nr:T9SS type B sorting domain-containing protein [Christiangramia sabulilitoris]